LIRCISDAPMLSSGSAFEVDLDQSCILFTPFKRSPD
jgi:hypothetical protein